MRNEIDLNEWLMNSRVLNRKTVIGVILIIALVAFEAFNFDTTRYALLNLLGSIQFFGLQWAGILAVAFCAIDFAGLIRIFTPEKGWNEPKEVWYLTGAWLLGATMNAIMTWWAVSLTLLDHQFGNEVLSREQLLRIVPIFVAVLVWLTRILFIGAFTVATDQLFNFSGTSRTNNLQTQARPSYAPVTQNVPAVKRPSPVAQVAAPVVAPTTQPKQTRSNKRQPAPQVTLPTKTQPSVPPAYQRPEPTYQRADDNYYTDDDFAPRPTTPVRPTQPTIAPVVSPKTAVPDRRPDSRPTMPTPSTNKPPLANGANNNNNNRRTGFNGGNIPTLREGH